MSQQDVEIAKQGGFNRRDVEALADLVTEDFELFTSAVRDARARALCPRATAPRSCA